MAPCFAGRFIRVNISWWKCHGYRQWWKPPGLEQHRTATQGGTSALTELGQDKQLPGRTSPFLLQFFQVSSSPAQVQLQNPQITQIPVDTKTTEVWSLQSPSWKARKILRHLISTKIKWMSWRPWKDSCLIPPWITFHASPLQNTLENANGTSQSPVAPRSGCVRAQLL